LGVHTDRDEFEKLAADKRYLSDAELELWHKIQSK